MNDRRTILGLCMGLGAALAAPRAYAANRFSVVGIANETQATITIDYRWGDRAWEKRTLAPGAQWAFFWRYERPDENRSPDLHLKFDADSSASRYTEAKRLHGFASPENTYVSGHKYAFRYDGPSRRFIEIWDVSPSPGAPPRPRGTRID